MGLNGRRRYLVGAVASFTFLVVGLLWLLGPETVDNSTSELSSATLPDLRHPSASPLRFGGPRDRPLVITFFFSDCVGCIKELPWFETESKKWGGKIDVIGVDHFETRAAGLGLLDKTKITFPVAWDETGMFAPTVNVNAFPATLFVDRSGIVRRRVLGQMTRSQLQSNFQSLFTTFHAI